jgi:hypothetical protein
MKKYYPVKTCGLWSTVRGSPYSIFDDDAKELVREKGPGELGLSYMSLVKNEEDDRVITAHSVSYEPPFDLVPSKPGEVGPVIRVKKLSRKEIKKFEQGAYIRY